MASPISVRIDYGPGYLTVVLGCLATGEERWQRRFPAVLWEMLPPEDTADLLADAFFLEHPELADNALFRASFAANLQMALEHDSAQVNNS
ncbi:hypothetical protein [Solirubrum puertoriconensis]|uniref:Uncharacterized protein n=1 Tax=Solirubrum puertoriconensis TaxID=1751427 RepID=A0A9X0L4F0_SOLP1|nr:hypothetical protein [Solirubrum puertoriconensis]KUG07342.1 hypothetical protein ASU33_13370 [Solirubrum puertoriconensis]